jgi:hypothetical protein
VIQSRLINTLLMVDIVLADENFGFMSGELSSFDVSEKIRICKSCLYRFVIISE